MERYLSDYAGGVADTRNATDLSRFCRRLVDAFAGMPSERASVNVELTGFAFEALYKGLWNVCARDGYRGRVRVHKQDGILLLIKERR